MTETLRIIVGVGDAQDGVRPLVWACAEARRRGAQLHAIRVWDDDGRPGPMSGDWHRQLEEAALKTLTDAFHNAIGSLPGKDLDCRLIVLRGDTSEVLLDYADRDDDLLVLGASRHRPLWPFGRKTVRRCVHRAICAVVVVPPVAWTRSRSMRKLVRELHRDLRQLEGTHAARQS